MHKAFIILLVCSIQLFNFSCKKEQKLSKIHVKNVDITKVEINKLDRSNYFPLSLYSFIQAHKNGLFITPNRAVKEHLVFKYENSRYDTLTGVIRKGRGPNELVNVSASSKTSDNDTLLFYSSNSVRYLGIDEKGELIEPFTTTRKMVNTGYQFAYNNGYLLIPSFLKGYNEDYLFSLINVKTKNIKEFFKPRVPIGYEPAIRNRPFTIGALPDGFAIAFVGDRKIYITDFDGILSHELIFGDSEPIPEPFKINDPNDAPSSKPFVLKVEYHSEHIFVLLDKTIWVLHYPSYTTKAQLQFKSPIEDKLLSVIGFSVNDNNIFLRVGRDDLYVVPINKKWFN